MPVTYALIGSRMILMSLKSSFTLESIIFALIILAIVFWIVGYSTFKFAEYWTKQRGKLSAY